MSLYHTGLACPSHPVYMNRINHTYPPASQKQAYYRGLDRVGGSGLGGTGIFADTRDEILNIDNEFKTMNSEMFVQLPTDLNTPAGQFYTAVWSVFGDDWRAFRDKQLGFLRGAVTAMSIFLTRELWKELQGYRGKLVEHRVKAEEAGYVFTGPGPTPPKTNVIEDAANQIKHGLDSFWRLIKFIIYAGVILLGGFLALQAYQSYRSGR